MPRDQPRGHNPDGTRSLSKRLDGHMNTLSATHLNAGTNAMAFAMADLPEEPTRHQVEASGSLSPSLRDHGFNQPCESLWRV